MNWNFVLLGALGGVIPDVIRLIKVGDTGIFKAPDYLKQGFFYVILILQIAFGALMVYLLHVHEELQAVIYGYAAPQVFTSLASGVIKENIASNAKKGKNIATSAPTKLRSQKQEQISLQDALDTISSFATEEEMPPSTFQLISAIEQSVEVHQMTKAGRNGSKSALTTKNAFIASFY